MWIVIPNRKWTHLDSLLEVRCKEGRIVFSTTIDIRISSFVSIIWMCGINHPDVIIAATTAAVIACVRDVVVKKTGSGGVDASATSDLISAISRSARTVVRHDDDDISLFALSYLVVIAMCPTVDGRHGHGHGAPPFI
jgi:hypothetical protein